jgi:hypothetical protein
LREHPEKTCQREMVERAALPGLARFRAYRNRPSTIEAPSHPATLYFSADCRAQCLLVAQKQTTELTRTMFAYDTERTCRPRVSRYSDGMEA